MKKLLLLTSVLAWISGVSAEEKPKLIVGVVISHFYPEWMDMYGNELSENGLKRVMKQGARVNVNYNYFYKMCIRDSGRSPLSPVGYGQPGLSCSPAIC